jgi:putative oxidoreductase
MQANAAVLAEHIYCYSLITNAAWSKYMVGSTTKAALESWVDLAARVLLALLFLLSGLGKLGAYSATAAYMSSAGIPGALLPLVIATEVLGALAVILGWKTRIAAFLVAGYSLLAAFSFHRNFADQMEMIQFLKDVSIAGGFLLLVTNGPGRRSIDRRLAT